jgi:hypothetical protein
VSLPADLLKFAAEHPGLVEAAVDLVKAMVAGDNKREVQAQTTLRRRVHAEKARAEAVAAVAVQPSAPVKVGRFVSARYAKPKTRKNAAG